VRATRHFFTAGRLRVGDRLKRPNAGGRASSFGDPVASGHGAPRRTHSVQVRRWACAGSATFGGIFQIAVASNCPE